MTHQAWINDLTEDEQLEIVKHHITAIKQLTNPSKRIIRYVIYHDPESITKHIKMEIEEQLLLVEKRPELFCRVSDPVNEVMILAVKLMPENIVHIDYPSRELQWLALTKNPSLINKYNDFTYDWIDSDIRTYANMVK